MLYSFFVF